MLGGVVGEEHPYKLPNISMIKMEDIAFQKYSAGQIEITLRFCYYRDFQKVFESSDLTILCSKLSA